MRCVIPWLSFALGISAVARSAEILRPGANLVTEGVPDVPASLVAEVKRYTEARFAAFAGWHPQRLEMLVGTRFGDTVQLHKVEAPLGMRRQLTYFEEPVSSAGFDPVAGATNPFSEYQAWP